MRRAWLIAAVHAFLALHATAQVTVYPYGERFDTAAVFPPGWLSTGFTVSGSSARSAPNCLSATGNLTTKSVLSPAFDFGRHVPLMLTFWERRSTTAAAFHLELAAEWDTTTVTLATFSSIPSTSAYVQRAIILEGNGFDAAPSVRFRWRIRGDSTSGTGVVRIDDIALTATASTDLAAGTIVCSPSPARRNDPVTAAVTVHNPGRTDVTTFTLEVYTNASADMLFKAEPVARHAGGPIAQKDSSVFSIPLPVFGPGTHWIGVRTICPDDEDSGNDTLSAPLQVGALWNDLIINEVMYAPANGESEWVELLNACADTIDLCGWSISDNNPAVRTRLTDRPFAVSPGALVIIAADSAFRSAYPGLSGSVLVARFSTLNNTTMDAVALKDAAGQAVDSMSYDPVRFPSDGRSLERYDHLAPAIQPGNWRIADSVARATPGGRNSVARMDRDIELSSIAWIAGEVPSRPRVRCGVRNAGRRAALAFRLRLTAREISGLDTVYRPVAMTDVAQPLLPLDSAQLILIPDSLRSGRTMLKASVEYVDDERTTNNSLELPYDRGFATGRLTVNEIMFDPATGSAEYVELYNGGTQPVDLLGWTISDIPTPSGSVNLLTLHDTVPAGGFAVVASDSTIVPLFRTLTSGDPGILLVFKSSDGLGLNNDGDAVILRDLTGLAIDSIRFDPSWHHPDVVVTRGRSLERINPVFASNDARNWSTSANPAGGTPGGRNSVFQTIARTGATLSIQPNPFSPDGDGFEDAAVIRYSLPFPSSIITVRIFDRRGRLVRWLSNRELGGREGTIVWDGTDDRRERVHIGPYILLMHASGDATSEPLTEKALVVVAKRF